jgi:acetoin utilization deacetylase AcuC-like enzyme
MTIEGETYVFRSDSVVREEGRPQDPPTGSGPRERVQRLESVLDRLERVVTHLESLTEPKAGPRQLGTFVEVHDEPYLQELRQERPQRPGTTVVGQDVKVSFFTGSATTSDRRRGAAGPI